MAVINGWFVVESKYGVTNNTNLTNDLSEYQYVAEFNPSPYLSISPSPLLNTPLTNNLPVDANGRSVSGWIGGSFYDHWYNTIHTNKSSIDFGNILTTQEETVSVWNAYFHPVTLLSITNTDSSVILSGDTPPTVFQGLEEKSWDITVQGTGSSELDATIVFSFSEGDLIIGLVGQRIVVFSFVPDWTDGVREELEWLTNIMQSDTGYEQRRSLRLAPRRTITADFILNDKTRRMFAMQTYRWGGNVYAIPVWWDVQLSSETFYSGSTRINCLTEGREFEVGGFILLLGETPDRYEAVEISGIDSSGVDLIRPLLSTWNSRTRLYPVKSGRLTEQPSSSRLSDEIWTTSCSFQLTDRSDSTATAPPLTYKGYSVWNEKPDETEDLTAQYERLTQELDNKMTAPMVRDVSGSGLEVRSHQWKELGRSKLSSLRGLMYFLKGRSTPVWVGTYSNDLKLTGLVSTGNLALPCENAWYSRYAGQESGKKFIRIEMKDGTFYFREILSAYEQDQDTEIISIDTAIPVDMTPSNVRRISFMNLCRLNDDRVEIVHVTDGDGVSECGLVFKEVRDYDI